MDEIKKFAVIGLPIAHSLSPKIHKEFAKQQGITIQYKMIEPDSDEHFETHAQSFFSKKGYGANITIPFKEKAFLFADMHDLSAIECGCSNTLISQDNKIKSFNTDGEGFIRDLNEKNIDISNKKILVLGAGGSARSIINSLTKKNVDKIDILSKTKERVDLLIDKYKDASNINNYQEGSKYDVIINTTPVSLSNEKIDFPRDIFNSMSIAYDLFYSKSITNFQFWSKENGVNKSYDGLGMLFQQAALSYKIWNSFEPSTKDLKNVLGF
tara:strand:+ start:660 stop:1466 length:807 start_codon:yes stop_codon:yes gene_type:complete